MQRIKLQLRILVPIIMLLVGTSALVFSALYTYQVAEQRLVDELSDRIRREMSQLQQGVEYRTEQSAPRGHIQQLLNSASIDQSIESLVLFSASGQILANRFAQNSTLANRDQPSFSALSQALPANAQSKIHLSPDSQALQAYFPLRLTATSRSSGEGQALLYASFDLSVKKEALWQQIRSDFQVIWLVASLVILALAFVLDHFVTRPLTKLVAFSHRLTNDYSGLQNAERYLGEVEALNQALNATSLKVARTVNDLNTQQENLEVTLYSIGDAVITTDEQGLVTRMNPAAEQLTGWYAYEARGQSLANIFPVIDAITRQPIPNPVDKVLSSNKTVYLDNHTTLIAKDGSEYQIADSAAPIRNDSDTIVGMVLVFNDVTEQYKLRQAARDIQLQIQGLLDDMQTMAGILEIDGTVVFMNNTPLQIRGIELNDIIGKELWKCPWFTYAVDVQSSIHADCLKAAMGEKILRDTQISTSRDELMWIQFSIHPVFDEQGQVIQLLAEGYNISERKKAEEELSASLQHIKLYREQTPLATIEWNMDFQIESWNAAATKVFGYSQHQAIGSDASIIIPASGGDEISLLWNNIIQQQGSEINISQNITKAGRSILCEWHNSAIVDPTGQVVGITSLVLDITAEHEAKLALMKKEQEQREILSTLTEGIITIDEKSKIQSINPAAEKIFGYSSDEICDRELCQIIPTFDIEQVDLYFKNKITTSGKPILDGLLETTGRRKNHSTFPLQVGAAELPPAADGSRRFIGSLNDLTETKLQQEHLLRTQKLDSLGKIVGGIAHDYNNMLGVILGYADLIAVKYQDIEGLKKYATQITQAGERGRDLTNRMLAFSKQNSSQPEAINLHSTLISQSELLGKSLTALIELDYQLCESPWLIYIDQGELEAMLLNLAINAKQAMVNGGVLTLATHKCHFDFAQARAIGLAEGDYMQLSIEDNGPGISEEISDKIFDPFFTTKSGEGTGLGLSQTYAFMDRSGGTIRLEPTPSSGSRFSLYFPRYEGAIAQQTLVQNVPVAAQANAEKILIVDDEPALREITQEILSMAGYEVLLADTGDAALNILANQTVDLLLSDIIMPQMSGYELAKIVSEKYPAVKIQLASGYSGEQALQQRQVPQHNPILRKPFRSAELLNTVAGLLEIKEGAL
jgi:PAS domain S-box-containing protein